MLQLQMRKSRSLIDMLSSLNWVFISLVTAIACVGFITLYSAAGGHMSPWASAQLMRFGVGFVIMLMVGLSSLRFWFSIAYVVYGIALALLILVEVKGHIGMGAQRWVDFHFFTLQPSELMKIALALALARFFENHQEDQNNFLHNAIPLALIFIPTLLVIKQPDLGSAILLLSVGLGICFLSGMSRWIFIGGATLLGATLPFLWHMLHGYQKKRILMFLNPEQDHLGAGYHIIQSKIALGSGGLWGKGFLAGTQSHLNFLPEKQTDFIFTMFSEEFGLLGALSLIMVYILTIGIATLMALRSESTFGKLISYSITLTLFIYMFINMAMVMEVVPVVGIPLPLVSYGGTALISLLFGFGLVLLADRERDQKLNLS